MLLTVVLTHPNLHYRKPRQTNRQGALEESSVWMIRESEMQGIPYLPQIQLTPCKDSPGTTILLPHSGYQEYRHLVTSYLVQPFPCSGVP